MLVIIIGKYNMAGCKRSA